MLKTILIADPDEDTRSILNAAVIREKMRVLEAADAQQAQRIVSRQSVDVVVMNCPMLLPSGISLARSLRKRGPQKDVPILNFTSHVMPDELRSAQIDGVTDTVYKPAHVSVVVSRIKRIVELPGHLE